MQESLISKNCYLVAPRELEIREEEVVLGDLKEGYCVIRPLQFGICGSDLKYFLGHKSPEKLAKRLPLILGHEGVAEVIESKSSDFPPGEKVGVIPFLTCGKCIACSAGRENYCSDAGYMASTAHGLAQQYMIYPADLLRKIPANVDLDAATLVEPMTIAYRAYKDLDEVNPTDKVVILGTGAIGYLVVVMVSHFGRVSKEQLYYIGIEDEKLALAEGFATGINSRTDVGQQLLSELTEQLDVAFECLGGALAENHTLPILSSLLRPGGKLGIIGLEDAPVGFDLNGQRVEIEHLTNFVNNGQGDNGLSAVGDGSIHADAFVAKYVMGHAIAEFFRTLLLVDGFQERFIIFTGKDEKS